jgi:hypothetical protein
MKTMVRHLLEYVGINMWRFSMFVKKGNTPTGEWLTNFLRNTSHLEDITAIGRQKKKYTIDLDVYHDKRTMSDLIRNAIQIQSACSLLGVVNSFSQDLRRLRTLTGDMSNSMEGHPLCILYASKIAQLSGTHVNLSDTHTALQWCQNKQ